MADEKLPAQLVRCGLTYRQADYWIRRRYLRVDTPGIGHKRQWSNGEVAVARRMVQLIKAGFTVSAAAWIARDMVVGGSGGLVEDGVKIDIGEQSVTVLLVSDAS